MSKKNLLKRILSFSLAAVFAASVNASAGVLTFETQYDYEEADIAWLTDLVIKEDMTTVEGMAQRVELIPLAAYPYTETADSFREEVGYFTSLYNIELGADRAAYLYFFELLNAKSDVLAADVSDRDIRDYLAGVGVAYPSSPSSDDLVMARLLFAALVTGTMGSSSLKDGISLEEAVVTYLADLVGMNIDTLKSWMPDGSVETLDEYILAASKLTLWSNGYSVTADTPDDEVYRLIAVMTVRNQGISADASLPYEELKLTYMATLLGEKYSVSIDSKKLGEALENDSVAFYILQLMGKKSGLSLRDDNSTYEQAFTLVAENTGVFDVTSDDFYADIYTYEVYLEGRCDSLWIYPTAYVTNLSQYDVLVSVNDFAVRNNYYNEIQLDPDKDEQVLNIEVNATGSGISSERTYIINVHQGDYSSVPGDKPVENEDEHNYINSDSIVANVLSQLGINSAISAVLDKAYVSLPKSVVQKTAFFDPTFDGEPADAFYLEVNDEDEFYISVLDEIGAVVDSEISGIGGITFAREEFDVGTDYVTFD